MSSISQPYLKITFHIDWTDALNVQPLSTSPANSGSHNESDFATNSLVDAREAVGSAGLRRPRFSAHVGGSSHPPAFLSNTDNTRWLEFPNDWTVPHSRRATPAIYCSRWPTVPGGKKESLYRRHIKETSQSARFHRFIGPFYSKFTTNFEKLYYDGTQSRMGFATSEQRNREKCCVIARQMKWVSAWASFTTASLCYVL